MNHFSMYHELITNRILAGETLLYKHQIVALAAIYSKANSGVMQGADKKAAYIGAGTACGKTIIQTIAPYLLAPWMTGRQALFLSDNCTLKGRLVKDFPVTDKIIPVYEDWMLYKLKVLPAGTQPPKIFVFDASNWKRNKNAAIEADILIGNRQHLIKLVENGELKALTDIGCTITDEAHFTAADSYLKIFESLGDSPLAYFTGSRYRSDKKPLPFVDYERIVELDEDDKEIVTHLPCADFEFTIQDAWNLKPSPIKRIAYESAHSESFLIEDDGAEIEMSPEEFFIRATNERQWLRGIILADSFCIPVLQMALDVLASKRAGGQPHCILIRALNVRHCHRLADILALEYPELNDKIAVIHSEHKDFDLEGEPSEIIQNIHNSKYIVVIHCAILGVGFDYKWFSISVCLGVLISMATAEQEWGRCLRRCGSDDPPLDEIDLSHANQAVLITHDVLNIQGLFQDYIDGTYQKKLKIEDEDGEGGKKFFGKTIKVVENYNPSDATIIVNDTSKMKVASKLVFYLDNGTEEIEFYGKVLQVLTEKEMAIEPINMLIPINTILKVKAGDVVDSIFIRHENLDWLILVNGGLVSYRGYVQKHNPLTLTDVEVPFPEVVVRPDLQLISLQRKYSNILKAVVAKELNKLPDKGKGDSLINHREHPLLIRAFEQAAKNNKSFTNNTSLALAAIFGRIRATTEKDWSDYGDESEYKNAISIGFEFVKELKESINEFR